MMGEGNNSESDSFEHRRMQRISVSDAKRYGTIGIPRPNASIPKVSRDVHVC